MLMFLDLFFYQITAYTRCAPLVKLHIRAPKCLFSVTQNFMVKITNQNEV